MPMTNPLERDEVAGNADLAAVYDKYGHTAAIARQLGGEAYVNARLAELQRIDDVYTQCKLLDEPLPKWAEFTEIRIACTKRRRSVS